MDTNDFMTTEHKKYQDGLITANTLQHRVKQIVLWGVDVVGTCRDVVTYCGLYWAFMQYRETIVPHDKVKEEDITCPICKREYNKYL